MATKPCRRAPNPASCSAIKGGGGARGLKDLVAEFLARYVNCIQGEEQMFKADAFTRLGDSPCCDGNR